MEIAKLIPRLGEINYILSSKLESIIFSPNESERALLDNLIKFLSNALEFNKTNENLIKSESLEILTLLQSYLKTKKPKLKHQGKLPVARTKSNNFTTYSYIPLPISSNKPKLGYIRGEAERYVAVIHKIGSLDSLNDIDKFYVKRVIEFLDYIKERPFL